MVLFYSNRESFAVYGNRVLILHVSMKVYCSTALAILQKHYHTLWRSFPNDHMITLTTLCEIFKISDDIIDMITSKPTFEEANRVMLDYVIFCTNGDQQMNAFCDLMVKIIDNPKLSKVTGNLRKGTCIYVHTYVYVHMSYAN